ncbi:unnamed protein product [Acidithrix sp. C25]|nr:unnamed protein product [Acidithrix sp. C25]
MYGLWSSVYLAALDLLQKTNQFTVVTYFNTGSTSGTLPSLAFG